MATRGSGFQGDRAPAFACDEALVLAPVADADPVVAGPVRAPDIAEAPSGADADARDEIRASVRGIGRRGAELARLPSGPAIGRATQLERLAVVGVLPVESTRHLDADAIRRWDGHLRTSDGDGGQCRARAVGSDLGDAECLVEVLVDVGVITQHERDASKAVTLRRQV